jgi:hypothetical protein
VLAKHSKKLQKCGNYAADNGTDASQNGAVARRDHPSLLLIVTPAIQSSLI